MLPLINSNTSFNSTVDIIAQSFLCGREIPIALSFPPHTHTHTTTTVTKVLTVAILVCLVFLHESKKILYSIQYRLLQNEREK